VYQCWRRICREMNVFSQVRISYVLCFISICDLFTDFPSSAFTELTMLDHLRNKVNRKNKIFRVL
jgi:hypothetical protein